MRFFGRAGGGGRRRTRRRGNARFDAGCAWNESDYYERSLRFKIIRDSKSFGGARTREDVASTALEP